MQAETSEILGIKQPHVSARMRNCSGTFSVERLIEFPTVLGRGAQMTGGQHARTKATSPSSLEGSLPFHHAKGGVRIPETDASSFPLDPGLSVQPFSVE